MAIMQNEFRNFLSGMITKVLPWVMPGVTNTSGV